MIPAEIEERKWQEFKKLRHKAYAQIKWLFVICAAGAGFSFAFFTRNLADAKWGFAFFNATSCLIHIWNLTRFWKEIPFDFELRAKDWCG